MGKFLGELGGFLMILLIVTLFIKLLWDTKIIKKMETINCFRKVSLFTIGMGVFYLFIGGFVYNYSQGQQVSIAEIETIWNYGNYGNILTGLEQGSGQGILDTIYIKLVYSMGSIFFGQFVSCSIYVSFIFTVIAVWLCFCGIKRIFGETAAWYVVTLGLVLPYAFQLFLPSSSSMICLLASIIFYGIVRKGNFKASDKVRSFQWNHFWTENMWVLICILSSFILFQNVTGR